MKNNLKTAVILAAIGGLMIMVGGAIGGSGGAALGMGIGLVFVGGSYWFSDKLAIRSARAVEVGEAQMPRYHAIVRDLCQRADMPMPRLYVSPDPQPNAFATGRSPAHAAVCVNQGILDVLTWEELQGVINLCFLFRGLSAANRGAEILASVAKREADADAKS